MKSYKFLLHAVAFFAIAALAVACSGDDESSEKSPSTLTPSTSTPTKETITITAYTPDQVSTRIGIKDSSKIYWHAADAIGVWSNGESKLKSFGLSSGTGTDKASFRGTVVGSADEYVVYPYNENHKSANGKWNYYLPNCYTYKTVDKTLHPTGKDGKSLGMPMWGKMTNERVVKFKPLGGVICLMIDKMPAEKGKVTVKADKQLCGAFTANLTVNNPEIKTSKSLNDNTVTFNYSNAEKDSVGVFYLPAAVGNYNLSIDVFGFEGEELSSTTASVEMECATVKIVNITVTTSYSYVYDDKSQTINGYKFVDLGLPSGLLWAETNVGAKIAADIGNYYAWGETLPKKEYSWDNYKYITTDTTYDDLYEKYSYSRRLTKYTNQDLKSVLDKKDDAASVNWGCPWRMPTIEEFKELIDTENCIWVEIFRENSSGSETLGCKVVSKRNGNSIFLPASGYRVESDLYYHGSYDLYWSSTLSSGNTFRAYYLYFSSGYFYSGNSNRCYGRTVRPVAKP